MKSLLLLFFLSSCAQSTIGTGVTAENNIENMQFIRKGLSFNQVMALMGTPEKREKKSFNNESFDIWYYLTKEISLGQTNITNDNLTPFIFHKGELVGWGYLYYDHFFSVENKQSIPAEKTKEPPVKAAPKELLKEQPQTTLPVKEETPKIPSAP